jgi:hypothetical protein
MSLLVSYLVVSKVYLSLDRYMQARTFSGQTLMTLRELHQLVLTFSFAIPLEHAGTDPTTVQKWRNKVRAFDRQGGHFRTLSDNVRTIISSYIPE